MNKFKSGVIVGEYVKELFDYAKYNNFAIPAVNCTGIDSINAILEAANIMRSPIIIQFSYNSSSFITGNIMRSLTKNEYLPSILGCTFCADYIHKVSKYYDIPIMIHTDHCNKKLLPWLDGILKFEKEYFIKNKIQLFSSHMIDLSNEKLEDNIKISSKYMKLMKDMCITLEIELGCIGGEEDGTINKNNVTNDSLYTNPNDILYFYKNLVKISENFIIAASIGNMHGVYKKGNVKLNTEILKNSQKLLSKELGVKNNYLNFVFHGGSGSNINDIKKVIKYGVVKINIDTDTQWASWKGILNYYNKNKLFLKSQLGNPTGEYSPNKKFYDPRQWIRESQISIINTLKKKFYEFNSVNSV